MRSAQHQLTAVTSGATFALTALVALAVYWLTLAPDLTWAHFGVDGGELITAVFTHTLPHPPGYPLYRLLTQPLLALPLGSVAWRFNLFSAFTMSLAAAFVALTSYQFPTARHPLPAIAVGLAFAFSPLVWSQALITEVYGLAMLLLAAFLWSLWGQRPFWFTGFLLGLSITAHPTAWLMLPLALSHRPYPVSHKTYSEQPTRNQPVGRLLAGVLLGLLPLVLLPWLTNPRSPIVWGDPTTWRGWWWLVSGQVYQGYLFGLPPAEWLPRLTEWTPQLLAQFTLAGLPLIIAGFFLVERDQRRSMAWLGETAVLYLFLAFTYRPDDAIIYTLPAWLLLSVLLTPALRRLGIWALGLPLALLLIHFNGLNLSADQQVRLQATSLLAQIPARALVETPGDATIFALWYFQHVEGQRPDLVLVDQELLAFDWYRARLAQLYPDMTGLFKADSELPTINAGKRPFCQATLLPTLTTPFTLHCIQGTQP